MAHCTKAEREILERTPDDVRTREEEMNEGLSKEECSKNKQGKQERNTW